MTTPTRTRELLATVDTYSLNSLRWGLIRQMFPLFVEEVEMGRYVKGLLGTNQCKGVRIVAHPLPDGSRSSHVFDLYAL
jgi:hypothetical protein